MSEKERPTEPEAEGAVFPGFVEVLTDPGICPLSEPAGSPHRWDGPVYEDGYCTSVSCSRCGALAITVDQWLAP